MLLFPLRPSSPAPFLQSRGIKDLRSTLRMSRSELDEADAAMTTDRQRERVEESSNNGTDSRIDSARGTEGGGAATPAAVLTSRASMFAAGYGPSTKSPPSISAPLNHHGRTIFGPSSLSKLSQAGTPVSASSTSPPMHPAAPTIAAAAAAASPAIPFAITASTGGRGAEGEMKTKVRRTDRMRAANCAPGDE